MRQVTPGPAPIQRSTVEREVTQSDGWTQANAIWHEDFCPDSTGIEAIDTLAPVHKAAVLALHEAQAARNEQERSFAEEDEQWKQALQEGTSTSLTGDRQRQLTLAALEEKVKTARAAVIASAQRVVEAVNATEDEWRSLLQSRQTIATDARAEADRLLTEAWQRTTSGRERRPACAAFSLLETRSGRSCSDSSPRVRGWAGA
jgi:hypothetical protein